MSTVPPDPPSAGTACSKSASSSSGIEYVCCSSGKAPLHVVRVRLQRVARDRGEVGVALDEARSPPLVEAEQVVPDEHLAVALGAGADADRDVQRAGDARGHRRRHALEHEREAPASSASASSNRPRLLGRAALGLEAAEHRRRLRRQPDVAHHGMPEPTSALTRESIGPAPRSSPRPRRLP